MLNKICRVTQYFVPNMLTLLVLVGIPAYVHLTFEPPLQSGDTMDIRPNAPGSPDALLERNGDACWVEDADGRTATGAIIRVRPTGPVILTYKPHLVDRALDQVINGTDRNIDAVFAFCTTPKENH